MSIQEVAEYSLGPQNAGNTTVKKAEAGGIRGTTHSVPLRCAWSAS